MVSKAGLLHQQQRMKPLILLTIFLVASVYGRPKSDIIGIHPWNEGSVIKCDLCLMFVSDLTKTIEGKEDEAIPQIIQTIVQRCESSPLLREFDCSVISDVLPPLLRKMTISPKEICRSLNFCESESSNLVFKSAFVGSLNDVDGMKQMSQIQGRQIKDIGHQLPEKDYQCAFCEDVITIIYDIVTHEDTWKQFAKLLTPLCKYYPYEEKCTNYIQQLPEKAHNFAMEFLNKEIDCTFLGFCKTSTENNTTLISGLYLTGSSGFTCDLCKNIITMYHDIMANTERWTEIINMLLPICKYGPYPEQCSTLLNSLPGKMKTWADKYLNKDTDCALLGICTTTSHGQEVFNLHGMHGNGLKCEICEGAIAVCYEMLTNTEIWTVIASLLTNTCEYCPVPDKCTAFFEELPATLKTFADKYLKKSECTALGLCTAPPPKEDVLDDDRGEFIVVPRLGGNLCSTCRTMIDTIHHIIVDSNIMSFISNVLGKICILYPSKKQQCTDIFAELPGVIKALADIYLNPIAACPFLRLCPRPPHVNWTEEISTAKDTSILLLAVTNQDPIQCEICEGLASVGIKVVNEHADVITKTLTDYFTNLCKELTFGPLRDECTEQVANVLPGILLNLIRDVLDPNSLCVQMLGMCPQRRLRYELY